MKVVARKRAKEIRSVAFSKIGSQASNKISLYLEEFLTKRRNFNVIAVYIPINTEIDTGPVVSKLRDLEKVVCLPVIASNRSPLNFKIWSKDSTLTEDRFRVMIPASGELAQPDLILCPLLSFDSRGYRLGYGGGFYDRTIDNLRKKKRIFTIGCAFSEQMVLKDLPIGKYDKPLDGVVTENGLTFFGK